MRTRSRNPFTTVTTAGLLLPIDLLSRVVDGDLDLPGLSQKDFHLRSGERTSEAAARAWNGCLAAWKPFRRKLAVLPASDPGTSLTRDEWLLPLFQELGYGRLQAKRAIEIDGHEYPVSHGWENHVPIHLLSARLPLDRRTPGAPGAATRAPYSLVQELLNRSVHHRWGFVSNGLKLYLLRDNAALARAANVEFDLEAMMDGEVYTDFMLLYLLCHQSRIEIPGDGKPEDCWLEKWATQADQQGTRARDRLRDGVEAAIGALGAGFLTTKGNEQLRDRLRSGELSTQDYYRQLLRLVYRVLMLLVAEEKKTESGDNLFHPPHTAADTRARYGRFYSVGRIRSLASERRGTAHTDLYESLKVLFVKLRTGYKPLGIPGMGSFLFSDIGTSDLDHAMLANQDLLKAFRHLCYTEDTSGRGGGVRRPVDFGNLGSEELGSVYESLLELHPQIDTDAGPFTLSTASGHERKTTGSYYTPRSLISCLLDSALDPVVTEAIDIPDPAEAEKKLLALKVCDPACGSGHFLIAAAERMAMHLARLRTGDDQPNTLDIQHAKRDVIGHCIYGVDVNPMAVELCKVSLWMEALDPGKPLSFLDHHIQCGNSLLGATPRLLAKGIPDNAFKPVAGDSKMACANLNKRNRRERHEYQSGQGYLFTPLITLGKSAVEFAKLASSADDSLDALASKQQRYTQLVEGAEYLNVRFWADVWCAAFVWQKDESSLGRLCPTERKFRDIERNPHDVLPNVRDEVMRLARQYQFFHWHLAFPDAFPLLGSDKAAENAHCGWNGGFDVVLGNPPWERMKIQEKEWFGERLPEIANAPNAAKRRAMISDLRNSDPALYEEYQKDRRTAEGTSHFVRCAGSFPLCGRGDINTYPVFTELNRYLISGIGRVGCIVPSGIATDDTTKLFFRDLVEKQVLVSLFDFWETRRMFPGTDSRNPFCLLTVAGANSIVAIGAEYAFSARSVTEIADPQRRFRLTSEEISLLNPNTRTCPVFRSRRDAEITKAVYQRTPIFIRESSGDRANENPWGVVFLRMFDMANDSGMFRSRAELAGEGFTLQGNVFNSDRERFLPLYEAKMTNLYDHRYGSVIGSDNLAKLSGVPAKPVSDEEHRDPNYRVMPRYWVSQSAVEHRLQRLQWPHKFLINFRDVARSTDARTAIHAALPKTGVGHKAPLILPFNVAPRVASCLLANLNSFALDYFVRQSIGGSSLSYFLVKQLPIFEPSSYQKYERWANSPLVDWFLPRIIELSYTAWDLEAFALDCGYDGPPVRWDENRRFLIRCELDAAYFHLYLGSEREWTADRPQLREMFATPRDGVDFIMDTFSIVRRKDETKYKGEYRTKTTILTMYDQMTEAIRTSQPYQTWLDPLPGPPADADGIFIPVSQWTTWPSHIHPPKDGSAAVTKPVYVDPAFPGTYPEKVLCAMLLDLVIAAPGLRQLDYLDAVGLAMQPSRATRLLTGADREGIGRTSTCVPADLITTPSDELPWLNICSTLLGNGALRQEYGRLVPGTDFDAVRARYPKIDSQYLQWVLKAAERLRELVPSLSAADGDSAAAAREIVSWRQTVSGA